MTYFEHIRFANPEWLWLLVLVPIVALYYLWRRRKYYVELKLPSLDFADQPDSFGRVGAVKTPRTKLRWLVPASRALAFVILVLALARPQQETHREHVEGEGIDIILAIDVSSSMLVDDFKPNRLMVSKGVASRFIDKRKFDRIGLTAFAGKAMTQCPVTTDHYALKRFLHGLECGIVEDGTAIGLGLATAVNRLKESTAKSKIIILLTDGINTVKRMDPITAARLAKAFGIKVYTIGMGKLKEVNAENALRHKSSELVEYVSLMRVDERLLKQIASMTGGRYFSASEETNLEKVYDEIDELEKSSYNLTTFRRYKDYYFAFIFVGIFFLISEMILGHIILSTIP